MTLLDRRHRGCTEICAFLVVVLCGVAMGVPSGALGAEKPCTERRPEQLRAHIHSEKIDRTQRGHPLHIFVVGVRNGGQECTMRGYVSTTFVASRRPEDLHLYSHHENLPVHTVDVRPDQAAYFTFSYVDRASDEVPTVPVRPCCVTFSDKDGEFGFIQLVPRYETGQAIRIYPEELRVSPFRAQP